MMTQDATAPRAAETPLPVDALRILVLTNMYPPHHYGGYELSCRDVVDRWRGAGHDVTVLTSQVRIGAAAGDDPPYVRRELDLYWDDHRLVSPPIRRRLAIERANQARLARALTDVRPHVVSAWAMGAMSLGLLTTVAERRLPLVYVVGDDWLHYGPRLDAWARLWLRRPRLAAAVRRWVDVPTSLADLGAAGTACFVSDFTRRHAADRSGWVLQSTTVVPCGVATADFKAVHPPGQDWGYRLLYVGRIDPRKGIETVVRALPRLPGGATLEVIGRGDVEHLSALHRLVAELGVEDRVAFGTVDRGELAERYAAADVVVFPSVWEEPFGLVPLEAMACETPVVATGTGGSAEFLVDGVNCLLFPRGDATALAAALDRLAADQALRRRLVANGRATAADLSVDRYASRLEAWHRAVALGYADGQPADWSPSSGAVPG